MSRRAELAKIHIAKKDLGLDDDTYRAILLDVSKGKYDSAGDMRDSQLKDVIARFQQKGWKPKKGKLSPKSRDKASKDQVDKIRALWIDMHKAGIVRDGSERALNRYVKRMAKIDKVEWLWPTTARRVIEALKQWQARATK